MNTAGAVPIPNQRIENGIHAIGGIGLKILMIKEHKRSNLLDQPNIIPNEIPTTAAKNKPRNTLYKYQ